MRIFLLLLIVLVLTASLLITIIPVRASADSWIKKAPIPQPASLSGAAVVNGKIYAFGSSISNGTYFGIHTNYDMNGTTYPREYDPATNTWTTKRVMPTLRVDFAVAACQNKIYVIGGAHPKMLGDLFSVNEVYDPATDTWTTKAPMPKNESLMCANVVNGKIYVTSGKQFYLNTSCETEVYDPNTDSWASAAPMPIPVHAYASAAVDNKIYVLGGCQFISEGVAFINATQIYDPATDKWTIGAPFPRAVWYAAAGATTGAMAPKRIYVLGGHGPMDWNQVYDPVTDSWTEAASMPRRRSSFAVAVVNDLLYVMGGYDHYPDFHSPFFGVDQPFLDDCEQYTPIGYGNASSPSSPSPSPTVPEMPVSSTIVMAVLTCTMAAVILYKRKRKPNTSTRGLTKLAC